jgi:predicted NBD/HSP70 family sugar kinase
MRNLFQRGPMSRTSLAAQMGLTPMAVTRIVRELVDSGLVAEGDKADRNGRRGRRRIELSLVSSGAYVVGVKIHVLERRVVLADLAGHIVREARWVSSSARDTKRTWRRVVDAIGRVIAQAKVDQSRVLGIGVAAAGFVDPETGVLSPSSYTGGEDIDLRSALGEALGLPVIAENSNSVLALAEARFGEGRGHGSIVLVQVSAALGGSILVNGEVVRGAGKVAGLIGHIPAAAGGRRRCSCGRIGCVNTVASGWAVLADLGLAGAPTIVEDDFESVAECLDDLVARAAAGDREIGAAFRASGRRLGKTLAGLWAALDPEMLLLTGPVADLEPYVDGMREGWRSAGLPALAPERFRISRRDPADAAALLALDEFALGPRLDLARLAHRAPSLRATQMAPPAVVFRPGNLAEPASPRTRKQWRNAL